MRASALGLAFAAVLVGVPEVTAQTVVANGGTSILLKEGDQYTTVSVLELDTQRAYPGHPYEAHVSITTEAYKLGGPAIKGSRRERWFRDAEGRERFESGFSPDGSAGPHTVRLADPVGGFGAGLEMDAKRVRVSKYTPPAYDAANAKRTAELKEQARAKREARTDKPLMEALPETVIAGVRAQGVRSTYTIPAGREGNLADVRIVYEAWTSPELKIVLRSVANDPRRSKVTTEVTELKVGTQDPALFVVPEGFTRVGETGAVRPDPSLQ